ncbi:hypothetical protein [Oryzobacter telluris]|uniref:hypothetical protein n=1 Tax=Oryzobacter telluris TaxID=3149179 RepID=UPI00370D6CC2
MAKADREGLSLGYRIGWRLRYAAVSVFGPAQLGTQDDPQMKLRREKADKVEAARRGRGAHRA